MSSSFTVGPADLEGFLSDFITFNRYEVKKEEPDARRLNRAILEYQVSRSMLFMGSQGMLAPSNLRAAIDAAKSSGAIKEKSQITAFDNLMQEFTRWVQEQQHKQQTQQPYNERNSDTPTTTIVSKTEKINYDILAEQVEKAENIPEEKKTFLKQLLAHAKRVHNDVKDYGPIIGPSAVEYVKLSIGSR